MTRRRTDPLVREQEAEGKRINRSHAHAKKQEAEGKRQR